MPTVPYVVAVTVPGLRIASTANLREHWAARRRRLCEQQFAVGLVLAGIDKGTRQKLRAAPRVNLRLVRLGGRKLDRDNLAGGFKAVLDAVCKWLGVDDGDEDRLGIEWAQEPGGGYGVRIEFSLGGER